MHYNTIEDAACINRVLVMLKLERWEDDKDNFLKQLMIVRLTTMRDNRFHQGIKGLEANG